MRASRQAAAEHIPCRCGTQCWHINSPHVCSLVGNCGKPQVCRQTGCEAAGMLTMAGTAAC